MERKLAILDIINQHAQGQVRVWGGQWQKKWADPLWLAKLERCTRPYGAEGTSLSLSDSPRPSWRTRWTLGCGLAWTPSRSCSGHQALKDHPKLLGEHALGAHGGRAGGALPKIHAHPTFRGWGSEPCCGQGLWTAAMFRHVLLWSTSLPVRCVRAMSGMCYLWTIHCLSGIFPACLGMSYFPATRCLSGVCKACLSMSYFRTIHCLSGTRKACLRMSYGAIRSCQVFVRHVLTCVTLEQVTACQVCTGHVYACLILEQLAACQVFAFHV